jgi:hypothetical protein
MELEWTLGGVSATGKEVTSVAKDVRVIRRRKGV